MGAGSGLTVSDIVVKQPPGSAYPMIVVPGVSPDTIPVADPILAISGLVLVQVPPPASVSTSVAPTQTVDDPEIAAGVGLTVTFAVAKQPAGSVYVMVAVPTDKPDTMPDKGPTGATEGLLLDHVPPPASTNVMVEPKQTIDGPAITEAAGLTVKASVVKQPAGSVNVMVAVPAVIPVTIPERDPMEATPGLLLDHVPGPESDKIVVAPTHTAEAPEISAGEGLTVTGNVV